MAEVILDDLQNGYVDLVNYVAEHGDRVSPRGMPVRELLGATVVLRDITHAIPLDVGRAVRLEIGAAETAQLVAGLSDMRQLANVSAIFGNFSDDGVTLRGAYGPRVFNQIPDAIQRMVDDQDTRQAGTVIWKDDDVAVSSKDVPCTTHLQWYVRDNKLEMHTIMRSNDAWLGVTYDFWMFTRLQMTIAWALGIEPGVYRHTAGSLHIYERDLDKIQQLKKVDPATYTTPPRGFGNSVTRRRDKDPVQRFLEARSFAQIAVLGKIKQREVEDHTRMGDSARWYVDALADFRSDGALCKKCRYVFPRTSEYFARHADPQLRLSTCKSCRKIDQVPLTSEVKLRRRCATYGITVSQYEDLLKIQNNVCAICSTVPDNGRWQDFCIDHDHSTGQVRGLLCNKCNHALGLLGDSSSTMLNAHAYLQNSPFSMLKSSND